MLDAKDRHNLTLYVISFLWINTEIKLKLKLLLRHFKWKNKGKKLRVPPCMKLSSCLLSINNPRFFFLFSFWGVEGRVGIKPYYALIMKSLVLFFTYTSSATDRNHRDTIYMWAVSARHIETWAGECHLDNTRVCVCVCALRSKPPNGFVHLWSRQ